MSSTKKTMEHKAIKSDIDSKLTSSAHASQGSLVAGHAATKPHVKKCFFPSIDTAEGMEGTDYLRNYLTDCIISAVFCGCVYYLASLYSNPINYSMYRTFQNYFIDMEFVVDRPESSSVLTFSDIRTVNEVWVYLETVVLSALYDVYKDEEHEIFDYEHEDRTIMIQNYLIGVPRLRQLQAANGSCKIHSVVASMFHYCYHDLTDDNKINKEDIRVSQSRTFTYQNTTGSPPFHGIAAVYKDGGYVLKLAQSKHLSRLALKLLKLKKWINRQTRFISLNFCYINQNIPIFSICALYFEFPRIGNVIPKFHFENHSFDESKKYTYLAVQIVTILCMIFFAIQEIFEIKHLKLKYFLAFWSYFDVIHIITGIMALYSEMNCTIANDMTDTILRQRKNDNEYFNFELLAYWISQSRNWYGLFMFLSYIKMFKFFGINKTMRQLRHTLRRCKTDLISFTIMFAVVFFAFVETAYLLFGSDLVDFSTVAGTILALFRVITGDFDYRSVEHVAPFAAPPFAISYVFFIFFVLLNMYMAIINDNYADVKTEMSIAPDVCETIQHIQNLFKRCLGALGLRKIIKEDSRMRLRVDKIRDLLTSCGFTPAEIANFLSEYEDPDSADGYDLKSLMRDIREQQKQDPQTPSTIVESSITQQEFQEHREKIASIDSRIEGLIEDISNLSDKLSTMKYVQTTGRAPTF